jgi:hypothetical protein
MPSETDVIAEAEAEAGEAMDDYEIHECLLFIACKSD